MVYRIHFTVEDLARTRMAQTPHPLLELSAAVRMLRPGRLPMHFHAWRRQALNDLTGPDSAARMVLDLIPPHGWAPDFLVPTGAGSTQELLEQVRRTSRPQIRRDLELVAQWQPIPPWARHLPDDPDLLRQVHDSLRHLCAVLLTPCWQQITHTTTADQDLRMRQALTGGIEEVLASLNPRRVRWNPPLLEVAMVSGHDEDLHLEGRGLLLVPTVFGVAGPAIDPEAEPQPVMSFPVGSDHHAQNTPPLFIAPSPPSPSGPSATNTALAALLGRTRATILATIAEHPGRSTKELAALTGVTPPSASEHATTLRAAGLISTVRHHNAVLHSLTALGIALLNTAHQRP
ncbi:winged helix-turn-helix domain-containing protein [Streptomyces sp. NPDC059063]|uniref:winged helix-turn-helix domain-containing protein n=1 Tax=unclassified Streptomyces TaxID=2593676 RepID=UPI0036B293E5